MPWVRTTVRSCVEGQQVGAVAACPVQAATVYGVAGAGSRHLCVPEAGDTGASPDTRKEPCPDNPRADGRLRQGIRKRYRSTTQIWNSGPSIFHGHVASETPARPSPL